MGPIGFLKQLIYIRGPGETTIPAYDDDDLFDQSSFITSAKTAKALRNAYKNPVVCVVVNWITDQATTTPIELFQLDQEGKSKVIPNHPAVNLLNKPSRDMSGAELLSVTFWDLLISPYAQAFWHKRRNRAGQVEELQFMHTRRMVVRGSREELISHYDYYPNNSTTPTRYEKEDIVHIRLKPDPLDPKNGLSPLVCVAKELMIDDQTEEYTTNILTTQGSPGGLLMPPQGEVVTADVAKATRKYLREEFKGLRRGEIGFLQAPAGWVSTQVRPRDMSLREIQNTAEERICGALGIHPVVVGLGAGAAQSRVGAATAEFERAAWINRIGPLQDTTIQQIARQILVEFIADEELDTWDLRFDRTGVPALQPDQLREAQRWGVLTQSGIAPRSDAKRALGLEVTPADDIYLLGSHIVPVPIAALPPPGYPEPPESGGGGGGGGGRLSPASLEAGRNDEHDHDHYDSGEIDPRRHRYISNVKRLNNQQASLLDVLERDAKLLEDLYVEDLEDAFDDLGRRAVDAFWEVEGQAALARLGTDVAEKQDLSPQDVDRILQLMDITEWVQNKIQPSNKRNNLRSLSMTVGSVNNTMGLGVNLSDWQAVDMLARGGQNIGLSDFNTDTRNALFRAIKIGRSTGAAEGPIQLARRIESMVPAGRYVNAGSEYRARLIARTETKWAQNMSAEESYRKSGVFAGVFVSDGDIDKPCAAVDGKRLTWGQYQQVGPIAHPNCTRSIAPVTSVGSDVTDLPISIKPPDDALPSVGPSAEGFTKESFDRWSLTAKQHRQRHDFVDQGDDESLERWVSVGTSESINYKLRQGQKLLSHEQEILQGMNRNWRVMDENRVAFRGMYEIPTSGLGRLTPQKPHMKFEKGDTITLPSPTSASFDAKVAAGFSHGETLFEIHVKRGTKGIVTNDLEKEFIMHPGQKLKIVDVRTNVDLPLDNPYGELPSSVDQYVVAVVE